LRELDYFEELTGHYWPIGLRNVLMEAKKAVAAAQQEKKAALKPDTLALLSQRYDLYWFSVTWTWLSYKLKRSRSNYAKEKQVMVVRR